MTKLDLKRKLILAPMAEVNNLAFRMMCKQYGADIIFSEMVSANALVRANPNSLELAKFSQSERPYVLQLFGQNTENLVEAAKLFDGKVDMIDLNFGCPAQKILKQGAGAALLKRPLKIEEIVKAVVAVVKTPVSVKIRTDKNYLKIAKMCDDAGVYAITAHARTVAQGYSGKAEWSKIKKIKENVNCFVIGNGDVRTGADALQMFVDTGCDSVMIGRGAIGNPYVFKEIKHYMTTGSILPAKNGLFDEWWKLYKVHCTVNLSEVKMNAQWFSKGQTGGATLRNTLAGAKSVEEVIKIVS